MRASTWNVRVAHSVNNLFVVYHIQKVQEVTNNTDSTTDIYKINTIQSYYNRNALLYINIKDKQNTYVTTQVWCMCVRTCGLNTADNTGSGFLITIRDNQSLKLLLLIQSSKSDHEHTDV